jgi:predicted porin
VNGATITDHGGAIPFVTGAGVAITTPVAVGDNMDFESRYDRVMYTTPVFGGFRAQAGYGQKDNTGEAVEASTWYSGKLAGELQAALGYSEVKSGGTPACPTCDNRLTVGGSVSWLHTSGFNITGAYTTRELDTVPGGRDADHTFVKVGWKFGQHAISAAYELVNDLQAAGDEFTVMSVGYVWNPIRWAEFYAGYHLMSLDRPNVDVGDITVVAIGTRIRF